MQKHVKDEIQYKELLKDPSRLFGMSFLYVLLVLFGLGMLYLANMNDVGANAIPPAPLMDSSAFVQDIPLQTPAVLPPVDVRKAGVATDSLVARGRDLFRGNCVACHGETGQGDGPSAATLNPKPRNFHSLSSWTNGSKVSQIYKTLEEGIVKNGMTSYGYLPPLDRFALAHYVRSLAPGQPMDSAGDLDGLESAYQLSKGKNVSGQVPVKKAILILSREGAQRSTMQASLVARTHENRGAAAGILRTHAADLSRVFSSFSSRDGSLPSFESFVASVSAAPASAGFLPSVARLSPKDWSDLYAYLTAEVRAEKRGG